MISFAMDDLIARMIADDRSGQPSVNSRQAWNLCGRPVALASYFCRGKFSVSHSRIRVRQIVRFAILVLLLTHWNPEFPVNAATIRSQSTRTSIGSNSSKGLPSVEKKLQAAIAIADSLASEQISKNAVPGLSIAVVHDGKVAFAKGYGVRLVGGSDKIDADTVFPLASVSKSLTSTVVACLVSDKKVSWDSRISDLDPSFKMFDPYPTNEVTVRDMLCHRSGLPEHAGDILEDIGYGREEILHRLRYQPPASSFRSAYAYTNFGYTEGAVAAAKPTGMDWEQLSQERLFKPLGMLSSSFRYSDFDARTNKAMSHVPVSGGGWQHRQQRQPEAQSPAGGASSSANDLAKWMLLEISDGEINGKKVLESKELRETQLPQIFTELNHDGKPSFYGLGFDIGYDDKNRLRISHSGAFWLGASTCVNMIPSERVGICVLTNARPTGVAEGIAQSFLEIFLEGRTSRDWMTLFKDYFSDPAVMGVTKGFDYDKRPLDQSPALPHASYVGRYANDYFGEIEVSSKGSNLEIKIGPHHTSRDLKHYSRDAFTFELETENLTGKSGVIFDVGPEGRANALSIDSLNVRGKGVFARVE